MSAAIIVAEVGRHYRVPCMRVLPCARDWWMPADGWVPVLGPKHRDAEHLEFDYEHYHIDWRFISNASLALATRASKSGSQFATVLTNSGHDGAHALVGTPKLRSKRCHRVMPDFPQVAKFVAGLYEPDERRSGVRWTRLERAQAIVCNKLKPGNICPHRGIDLTPFVKDDGTAVCPGHGLRWNTRTGDLLPYQAL